MKHLLLPSLTTLAVLIMMPVSAIAGPALPMNDVLAELNSTKTILIQTGARSKRQRVRRSNEPARRSTSQRSRQLSSEPSQQTGAFNPAAAYALRLYYCANALLPIGGGRPRGC